MTWNSWSDFWSMGGYALYVWGAYAVTAVALAAETIAVLRLKQTTVRRVAQLRRAGLASGKRKHETET